MKRIIAFTLTIVTIAVAMVIVRNNRHKEMLNEWLENGEVIMICVNQGDTIDGYWVEYAPSFVNRYEWREIILELNGMQNCNLYAGNMIKIIKEAN